MERISYISLEAIDHIELFQNTQRWTLKQIVEKKKPDYAVTGGFYIYNTWKPTCQQKVNGKVLVDDGYSYRGIAWNTNDVEWKLIPKETKEYKNHYACCTLISNGVPYSDDLVNYNSDVGGKRGRTGIGLKDGMLVLYASTDGSTDAKTPEGLRDYLAPMKIHDFIMGDGGGKVNYYNGKDTWQGKDISQNLLLVYCKNQTQDKSESDSGQITRPESTAKSELKITANLYKNNPRQIRPTKKNKTGYMQHSTGTPGAMASAIIATFDKSNANAETEFVIDDTGIYQCMDIGVRSWHSGGSANNTHVGCEICEPIQTRVLEANWHNLSLNGKNNTKYAVELLQRELTARGYDTNGIDGIFGNGTLNAVYQFQKDNGLTADGVIGKATLRKLQNRNGSCLTYDKDAVQSYFEDVYNKAVFCCAYVMDQLNVDSITESNVLSHAEGYKKKIASNHADVAHWWDKHDKTMDDFRSDVKQYIKTGKLPYGDESMNELESAWIKCVNAGLFDGSNPEGPVSRRALATVLVRAGIVK